MCLSLGFRVSGSGFTGISIDIGTHLCIAVNYNPHSGDTLRPIKPPSVQFIFHVLLHVILHY